MPKKFYEVYPELIQYITTQSNKDVQKLSLYSNDKVYFTCEKGHTRSTCMKSLAGLMEKQKPLCKICDQRKLFEEKPEWLEFYDDEIDIDLITPHSSLELWWKDNLGRWKEPPLKMRSREVRKGLSPRFKSVIVEFPDIRNWISEELVMNLTSLSHEILEFTCPAKNHKFDMPLYQWYRAENKCPVCYGTRIGKNGENSISDKFPLLAENILDEDPKSIHAGNLDRKVTYTYNGEIRQNVLSTAINKFYNNKTTRSISEDEFFEHLIEIVGKDNIVRNERSLIKPKELDFYIPSKNIAIEFNGLYWHCEAKRPDINYHYNKWKECKSKGVELITIWKDQWISNSDIIYKILIEKLLDEPYLEDVFPLLVKPIDQKQSRSFLDNYHFNEISTGDMHYGVYDSNEKLIAVSEWIMNDKKTINLLNFSSISNRKHIFKFMIEYMIHHNMFDKHVESIEIIDDRCLSFSEVYVNAGFNHIKEIDPDCHYFIGKNRHKEILNLDNEQKIWDCGSDLYVLNL